MCPVNFLQRQAHEVGRIRLGDKGAKGAPRKLDCFRLTSQNRSLLEEAACKYGGEVGPWEGRQGHFEVYTTTKELPFLASPTEVSQWLELWNAGGCVRRCDGRRMQNDEPCACDPDDRECSLHTRFSVFLYQLQGLGVWRLETSGFYAAQELPAMADMLIKAAKVGRPIPATLSIEHRQAKRPGQPTRNYIVPVIHTHLSIEQILIAQSDPRKEALLVPENPQVTKAIEAAKPAGKKSFRDYMLQTTKDAVKQFVFAVTPESLERALFEDMQKVLSYFKNSEIVWTRLSNEHLVKICAMAETGKRLADDEAAKEAVAAIKAEFDNPTKSGEESDIGAEEL